MLSPSLLYSIYYPLASSARTPTKAVKLESISELSLPESELLFVSYGEKDFL